MTQSILDGCTPENDLRGDSGFRRYLVMESITETKAATMTSGQMKISAKKQLILFASLAMFCVTSSVRAQGDSQAISVRSAKALPAICKAGTVIQVADMIVVSGALYLCTNTNTWSIVGPAAGLDTTWANNFRMKGPVPWADVTAFGVKPLNHGAVTSTTASCEGTTAISLGSAAFTNGDGLTVYGCGPTNKLGTPPAPKVIPSLAEAGTVPVSDRYAAGAAGRSTYVYAVAAIDTHGGVTATGPTTTITTGQANLGQKSVGITSAIRTNDSVTYTTSSPHLLAVGAEVHVQGMSITNFDYWGPVASTSDSTHFTVVLTGFDTRQGLPSSATGGRAVYFTENFVYWNPVSGAIQYAVYGKRPGDSALGLLWITPITGQSGGGFPYCWYSDFGATMSSNLSLSTAYPYVPSTAPTSATNDYLSTTVVSGGGTTSIVVANAASRILGDRGTGTTAIFDDAPTILAAANSISWNAPSYNGGTLYFPPVPAAGGRECYIINSYLRLPAYTNIKGAGAICANAPIEISSNTNWDGSWASPEAPSFSFSGRQTIYCYVWPCVYTNEVSHSTFSHMSIASGMMNGDILWQSTDAYQDTWNDIAFDTGRDSNNDYFGIGFLAASTSTGGNIYDFDHVSFTGGPSQTTDMTWAPLVLFMANRDSTGAYIGNSNDLVNMSNIFLNLRGIEHDNYGGLAGYWNVEWIYRQGGITPLFTFWGGGGTVGGFISIKHSMQDTETSPLLALIDNPAAGGSNVVMPNIILEQDSACGALAQYGKFFPLITGQKPVGSTQVQTGCGQPLEGASFTYGALTVAYPWETSGSYIPNYEGHYGFGGIVHILPPYELIVDLMPPTGITATLASGGGVPAGTYTYEISSVDINGGEGNPSFPTSPVTTTRGIQTVNLAWKATVGAVSYNVYRCNSSGVGCTRLALHHTGTNYPDSSAGTSGYGPPQTSGAGSTIISGSGVQTIQGQVLPQKFAALSACTRTLQGAYATVADSTTNTWGATVTGGGSDAVLAFCDGTNWTVYGK
jgi:hypothetical protein